MQQKKCQNFLARFARTKNTLFIRRAEIFLEKSQVTRQRHLGGVIKGNIYMIIGSLRTAVSKVYKATYAREGGTGHLLEPGTKRLDSPFL